MRKGYVLSMGLMLLSLLGFSQFQLNTVPPLNGGNGSNGITFGLTAHQTIIVDTIFGSFNSSANADIWYTTTDLTGPPNITAANGWVLLGGGTVAAAPAGSITAIPFDVGLLMPAGTTYRFHIAHTSLVYTTGTAGAAAPFTDGNITIETGNLVGYGGGAPSPTFHPRQFNGGVKYSLSGGGNDAAVLSVDSPTVYCAGTHNVYATIANFGSNQIDSVEVNWSVGGVAQPMVKYIGLLDTLNAPNPNTAQVLLGSAVFAAGMTEIEVYTANPNGVADTSNLNDTITSGVMTAAPPTSVVVSNTTLNSAMVNAVGGAGTINYEYGPFGFAQGTGTTGSSGTPAFTLSGLTPSTTYEIYVQSDCGGGDASGYVGPIVFNTSNGIPYLEEFTSFNAGNATNPWPNGWTSTTTTNPRWEAEDASGSDENSTNTGPFFDNTTPGVVGGMYIYLETSGGAAGNSADFISPPIFVDSALSTVEFEFAYHMWGATMGDLEVWVDTTGLVSPDSITTIVGQQHNTGTDPWSIFSTLLNGYNGKSLQLIFRGIRGTSFTGDMSIDDVSLSPVLALNAGVADVVTPSGNICPGTVTPVVAVENNGSDTLTSVEVQWEVNGVLDSVLYSSTILPGDTAHVTLGSVTLSSGTIYDIKFYTDAPNGMADQFNGDDTLRLNGLRTGLSGTFTLDAGQPSSATNFASFAELEQQLNNYGVCGPTTINVAAGTYNENLTLDQVAGLSASSPLTIDGGDSADVFMTNALPNNDALVVLRGASYVTLKNMTLVSTNTGTSDHFGVHLGGGFPANNDSLVNLHIIMNPTNTFGAFGIGASSDINNDFGEGNNANNTVVMGCNIEGGDYSIHFEGGTAGNWNVGNQFINNTLSNMDEYGIYLDEQDSVVTNGNTISGARSTFAGRGIYGFDCMNFICNGNNINGPDFGIYFSDANSDRPADRRAEVINNMVISSTDFGIYLIDAVDVDVFHNSVWTEGPQTVSALYMQRGFSITNDSISNCDVRNNILAALNGLAFEMNDGDSVLAKFDNNVFYTTGANLIELDGSQYTDLVTFQAAFPTSNVGSLEGDPQFLSPTDLHIVGAFPNDAGDNSVGVTVDIDGDARPIAGSTIVDIGADEYTPPLCPPASNLGIANPTLTSIDIHWDGTGNSYEYEVVTAGSPQGSGISGTTMLDSITVGGLTPSTAYEFWVRIICGRGDTAIWVKSSVGSTANGIPYLEDFETFAPGISSNPWPFDWNSTTTTNPRWESEDASGADENSIGTGPFFDNTNFNVVGGIYIYLETSGGAGGIADLSTPSIFVDSTQSNVRLEFAYHMWGATMGDLEILVDSNGTVNSLGIISGQQHFAGTDPWLTYSATIAGYQGKSIQVIFRGTSGSSFTSDMAIDDVRLFVPAGTDAEMVSIDAPATGCGLGAADTITVTVQNVGTDTIMSLPVSYTINGGTAVNETISTMILPGDTLSYDFNTTANLSALGNYNIVAYTALTGDADVSNDTTAVSIDNIPVVNTFPYSESFETGNGGWVAGGNSSSWALGAPSNAIINSAANGTQAWVTNLTGLYNSGESSFVESPCLDFTNLAAPQIKMEVWWNSEFSWDGAVLQSSVDGGATWQKVGAFGDPNNWYTDNSVNGLGTIEPSQEGWTGRASSSNGSGGWVLAENDLTGLGGDPAVRLRIAFGSDGSVQDEGFAFDNILIQDAPADDIGVVDFSRPLSACGLSAADSVAALIANFGSDTVFTFDVSYVMNAGTPVTETVNTTLLPGDTMEHVFSTTVNLTMPGTYDFDGWTTFAGDANPLNDSLFGYQVSNSLKVIPYTENFDALATGATGSFANDWQGSFSSPNFQWRSNSGTTTSTSTGPTGDHTSGTGIYMYTEASSPAVLGDTAILTTPCFDLSLNPPVVTLEYWYHMYGADIQTLFVEIDSMGSWITIDTIVGQQQTANADSFRVRQVSLNGFTTALAETRIRFWTVRGNSFNGDVAIDDVSLTTQPIGISETEVALNNLEIYPNPSNGEFTLNMSSDVAAKYELNVRTVEGQEIYNEIINVNGKLMRQFDFSKLAKGVYFIEVRSGEAATVKKLIIQ